jgi:hypothetical protein
MKNKSSLDYENIAKRRLFFVLFVLSLTSSLFYFLQNSAFFVGGAIALPKLIWLSYAILFWYFIPILIVLDKRVSRPYYLAFLLFLINMSIRAVVELWMIYFTHSWHPYYGIAHNVFSAIVVAIMFIILHRKSYLDAVLSKYLLVLVFMFVAECIFAGYLLSVVWKSSETIYFVPEDNDHIFILNITWVVVSLLTVFLIIFSRRWLNGTIKA